MPLTFTVIEVMGLASTVTDPVAPEKRNCLMVSSVDSTMSSYVKVIAAFTYLE